MKITEILNEKIRIADIETLKGCILLGFYNPDDNKWDIFEISRRKNDIYAFLKFYNRNEIDRIVWYNGIAFDCQVIQFILEEYTKWDEKDNLYTCNEIYKCALEVIENKNYGLFNKYQEYTFEISCYDVYTILGLDNEVRRSSLKKCEFNIDFPSVEEMPIHHSIENLSDEQIEEISSYMKNDIMATYSLFNIVLGNTEHNIYKGNNQIETRYSIKEEFGVNCVNYADIKIGDEIIKKYYAETIGKDIRELPKKGMFRKQIYLNKCIPSYVKFETKELQSLLSELKKTSIKQTDKFEKKIKIGVTTHSLMKGGIHAENKNEVWEAKDGYIIEDDDISSYYPAIIVNNKYYPYHLGKELLNTYETLYHKRIELKPFSKKDKKIKGIVDGLKLSLNAIFGKLGSMDSWLYDAQALFSVTLTGEMTILMLIEQLEKNGIKVISSNTDGVTSYFHESKKELKDRIIKEWKKVTNFEIETVRFKKIYYLTVNDYLGIKQDDTIKVKGDLISDFEIYKNKSWRIVALAVQEYLTKGTSVIDFINAHKNIYDFCLMTKATGNLYIEMYSEEEIIKLKKLVRYYISSIPKWKLYKRGTTSTDKNANISIHANDEIGDVYIQYFNQFEQKEEYNVDRRRYILKALKIIDRLEGTKRTRGYIEQFKPQKQLTLF